MNLPLDELRAEREASIADLDAVAALFGGTGESARHAQFVIAMVRQRIRAGQAKRGGPCGKRLDCGGSCALPVGHTAEPCKCAGDNGDGCPA